MTAAIRLEVATQKVAEMTAQQLVYFSDSDECWRLARRVGVPFDKLSHLIKRERVKRGSIKLSDLRPQERRKMVDPNNLDLHALAAGPIMDVGEIYLPAGKLSMAETRAREQANILPNEGTN